MRAQAYELPDLDTVERFFGQDPEQKPVLDIARGHGELVWEGDLPWIPAGDADSTLTIATDPTEEFVVFARTYLAEEQLVVMVVGRAGAAGRTVFEA